MSGFEVLSRVRIISQLPVIVFTGKNGIAAKALQEGANDFISKPFNPEDLTKKIRTILE